jgi:hypothetical protein
MTIQVIRKAQFAKVWFLKSLRSSFWRFIYYSGEAVARVCIQGLALARQVLYHLAMHLASFALIFDIGSGDYAWAGFPHSWNNKCTTMPSFYWWRWRSREVFAQAGLDPPSS